MILDLTSLEKALLTLKKALNEYQQNSGNELMRDGCIQRFEYCYELSCKMLRRFLELTEPSTAESDRLLFPDLIRLAAERGLLKNSWDIWMNFRKERNKTSHAYDSAIAEEVFAIIPSFLEEAEFLLHQMKERNA